VNGKTTSLMETELSSMSIKKNIMDNGEEEIKKEEVSTITLTEPSTTENGKTIKSTVKVSTPMPTAMFTKVSGKATSKQEMVFINSLTVMYMKEASSKERDTVKVN